MKKILHYTTDIAAGVVSGLVMMMIGTAITALIFKDSLDIYFSVGISCALVGSCLVNLLVSSFSIFRFSIARVEPSAAAILGIIFANIAHASMMPGALLPTLLATFFIICVAVGITMFMLGFFRLGQAARFLPYPVLSGIITGTGWIMGHASFSMMTNTPINIDIFSHLNIMLQYLAGIGFAIFLLVIPKLNTRSWILPFSLFFMSFLVDLLLKMNHITHTEAVQMGWLFTSFKPTFALNSINFSLFQYINWSSILEQFGYIVSLIGIVIIILLFNVSSLEYLYKEKADLERELKINGIANCLNGLLLGIPANLSLSGTLLNKNTGASSRLAGWISSLVCLAVLFLYPNIISYLPKPIIGGLLLFVAIKLIIEWLFEGWKKLPLTDYFIVILILVTIATVGFLQGMMAGLVITCFMFIVQYTRTDTVKLNTTAENYRSNVIRPIDQQQWLADHGKKIQIFKLQGYLFFGSVKLLLDRITRLLDQDKKQVLQFLIFDFQWVNGIDSSASMSFIRLQQLIEHSSLQLIFTHCTKKLIQQFNKQGVFENHSSIMLFADLDQGMEWCENHLLEKMPRALAPENPALSNTLSQLIPTEPGQQIFRRYLEKIETAANFILLKQGDVVDCLYFIESGEVSIFIEHDQTKLRLAKSGAGTIVGEIGFYLHTPRTATVSTDTPCIIYKLTRQALSDLEIAHPDIALLFQKSIIHVLSMRVIQTNYELTLVAR